MVSICTWNVNGLRACAKKGFTDWLAAEAPDVLCLQETKARPEQVTPLVSAPKGYRTLFAPAKKPGYSGTAMYTRRPGTLSAGLDLSDFDDEGRTVIGDFDAFVVLGCYFPNSQPEHGRLPYKLAYDEAVAARCRELRSRGREVVICGDFNAAHTEIDLANPKQNEDNAGFLPEERAWVTAMLDEGWVDVFRERHPGEKGHYTWWTYRSGARARNVGWRLDYFLLSPGLARKVHDVRHLTLVEGSDHCPVRMDLDL